MDEEIKTGDWISYTLRDDDTIYYGRIYKNSIMINVCADHWNGSNEVGHSNRFGYTGSWYFSNKGDFFRHEKSQNCDWKPQNVRQWKYLGRKQFPKINIKGLFKTKLNEQI